MARPRLRQRDGGRDAGAAAGWALNLELLDVLLPWMTALASAAYGSCDASRATVARWVTRLYTLWDQFWIVV